MSLVYMAASISYIRMFYFKLQHVPISGELVTLLFYTV